jgi:hypothetical protein
LSSTTHIVYSMPFSPSVCLPNDMHTIISIETQAGSHDSTLFSRANQSGRYMSSPLGG